MTEVLPVPTSICPGSRWQGRATGCASAGLAWRRIGLSPLDALGQATGSPQRSGVTGEICVGCAREGGTTGSGRLEQASSRDAGWHRTGDVGHLDDHGRLWVEGRLAHVIVTATGPLTPVGTSNGSRAPEIVAGAAVGVGPRHPAGGLVVQRSCDPDEGLAAADTPTGSSGRRGALVAACCSREAAHRTSVMPRRSTAPRWPDGPARCSAVPGRPSIRVLVTGGSGLLGAATACGWPSGRRCRVIQRRPAGLGLPEVLASHRRSRPGRGPWTRRRRAPGCQSRGHGSLPEYHRINVGRNSGCRRRLPGRRGGNGWCICTSPSVAHRGRSVVGQRRLISRTLRPSARTLRPQQGPRGKGRARSRPARARGRCNPAWSGARGTSS